MHRFLLGRRDGLGRVVGLGLLLFFFAGAAAARSEQAEGRQQMGIFRNHSKRDNNEEQMKIARKSCAFYYAVQY